MTDKEIIKQLEGANEVLEGKITAMGKEAEEAVKTIKDLEAENAQLSAQLEGANKKLEKKTYILSSDLKNVPVSDRT